MENNHIEQQLLRDNIETIKSYFYDIVRRESGYINQSALIQTCTNFNLYYSKRLYDLTYNNLHHPAEFIASYLRNLNLVQYRNKSFIDSEFD